MKKSPVSAEKTRQQQMLEKIRTRKRKLMNPSANMTPERIDQEAEKVAELVIAERNIVAALKQLERGGG